MCSHVPSFSSPSSSAFGSELFLAFHQICDHFLKLSVVGQIVFIQIQTNTYANRLVYPIPWPTKQRKLCLKVLNHFLKTIPHHVTKRDPVLFTNSVVRKDPSLETPLKRVGFAKIVVNRLYKPSYPSRENLN